MPKVTTRLAPSPTGELHLGNAWSFLICWLAARSQGGKVLLRIDDIDPQRSKQQFTNSIIADLRWLGLDWDGEPVFQSQRYHIYEAELAKLQAKDLVYPCFCTRKELRSLASAPHIGDEGAPYSGKCRLLDSKTRENRIAQGHKYSLRLQCPDQPVCFNDLIQGPQIYAKMQYGGDFAIRRSDGVWAYQLASAIDDAKMGVNLVIRGRDLLPSTPRQILIGANLGYPEIAYGHIPLLIAPDGERLAKRHQSLALRELREKGIKAEQICGYLGFLAGIKQDPGPASASSLLAGFEINKLPTADLIVDNKALQIDPANDIP